MESWVNILTGHDRHSFIISSIPSETNILLMTSIKMVNFKCDDLGEIWCYSVNDTSYTGEWQAVSQFSIRIERY